MFGNIVETFFFFLEGYHFISHAVVLFRVRLLPRKDLVRVRYYFLIDTATVFTVCFLITGRLQVLAVIQIFQHVFYFLTWEKSVLARKVVSWSSLEWTRSPQSKKWETFEIVGTTFDMLFHLVNAYILSHSLSTTQLMFSLALIQAAIYLVLHNPRSIDLDNQVQLVQNFAARLVCRERPSFHIPPLLVDLYWLPIKQHIDFKVSVTHLLAWSNPMDTPQWVEKRLQPLAANAGSEAPCVAGKAG